MKTRIFLLLFAAGLAVTGCSSTKEGQTGSDSISAADSSGMSGMRGDSTTAPVDTARNDSTMRDTTRRPPL